MSEHNPLFSGAPEPAAPSRGPHEGAGEDTSSSGEHRHLPLYAEDSQPIASDALAVLRRQSLGLTENEAVTRPLVPAALFPYQNAEKVRTDYPLLLLPNASDRALQPLADTLAQSLSGVQAQGRPARIVADNLLRLERLVRRRVQDVTEPISAHVVLRDSADSLVSELGLDAANATTLRTDLETMTAWLPEESRILNLFCDTDLFLLWHAAVRELALRRQTFRLELEAHVHALERLLEVEASGTSDTLTAEALQRSMGAEDLVDAGALLGLLGNSRGSEAMSLERRGRIERSVVVLRKYLDAEHGSLLLLGRESFASELSALPGVETRRSDQPIVEASVAFDEQMLRFIEVFRALRVARLELEQPGGAYLPPRHDAWLSSLDWQALTREELLVLPWVVAVEDASRVAGEDLHGLSRLLLSGKPVHVVTRVDPAQNPGATSDHDFSSFRMELGYFAISLREALVVQSMTASPEHLYKSLVRAASSTRTSLLLVAQGPQRGVAAELGYWLGMHAALESRAHPFYVYDPEGGPTWARRVDFSGNPNPEVDWPVYSLDRALGDAEPKSSTQPFTFADFALLNEAFAKHFILVPDTCRGDESLVNVEEYLRKPGSEAVHFIPFIWAVDASGRAQQVAITRQLALACRDRLGFWRTLQELAGIRNEHVETAVARAREQAEAKARQERDRLEASHAEELNQVRQNAAAEVMQRLAAALLDLDPATLASPQGPSERASAPSQQESQTTQLSDSQPAIEDTAPDEEQTASTPAEESTLEFDEPWIDSALCTSCNDCMAINPLLFVYNDNKQARIGDVKAGSYAELVRAAKQCPARCIHPGKPQDPDEPGLDELVAEAEPFN